MASQLASPACSATSNRCAGRSRIGVQRQLSDEVAKLIIYRAFIERELEVPRHLARVVHDRYFVPQYEEFAPRTMRSLSNAFTSAFKELDAIRQFQAAAKLGAFLEDVDAA